jgi:hypothetical protein
VADVTSNANATLNSGAAAYLRPDMPPKLLASDAFSTTTHRHGEPDPSRYRLFPACLGSICREPFEGEVSDTTNAGQQCRCSPTPLQRGGQEPP